MVTHHWANNFRDLTAAVLADALGLKRWDGGALGPPSEGKHRELPRKNNYLKTGSEVQQVALGCSRLKRLAWARRSQQASGACF